MKKQDIKTYTSYIWFSKPPSRLRFFNLFFSLIKGKFYLTNPTEKRSRQILEKLTAPQMTLTPYAISQRSYLDKFKLCPRYRVLALEISHLNTTAGERKKADELRKQRKSSP